MNFRLHWWMSQESCWTRSQERKYDFLEMLYPYLGFLDLICFYSILTSCSFCYPTVYILTHSNALKFQFLGKTGKLIVCFDNPDFINWEKHLVFNIFHDLTQQVWNSVLTRHVLVAQQRVRTDSYYCLHSNFFVSNLFWGKTAQNPTCLEDTSLRLPFLSDPVSIKAEDRVKAARDVLCRLKGLFLFDQPIEYDSQALFWLLSPMLLNRPI